MAAKKKTTKRGKTSHKKNVVETSVMEMETPATTNVLNASEVKRVGTKTKIALILAFIIIVAALYKGKGLFVAALVNNQPITRLSVISDLEKHSGKQSLDSLITQTLIDQEAKKKGVSVSSSDIDSEIQKISESVKAQGQDLNSLLALQGMTMDDLRGQMKTQKLVEKLLGSDIDPTDADIDAYIKTNKDTLPKDQSEDQIKSQVKEQLKQQNLSTKFQTWITDLKGKANIKYYVNY